MRKRILALIIIAILMIPGLSSCAAFAKYDLSDSSGPIRLVSTDFAESNCTVHANAEYSSDYTYLSLAANYIDNFGYLVRTIDYHVAPGTYRFKARVRMSIGNPDDPITELHVIEKVNRQDKIIAGLNIMGPETQSDFIEVGIDFETEEDKWLSFGVYTNGRNRVDFDWLEISYVGGETSQEYSAEILSEDNEDRKIQYEEGKLYYFDALPWIEKYSDYVVHQEFLTTLAALQGLVNRDGQRLFVRLYNRPDLYCDGEQDLFWLEYLRTKNYLPSAENTVTVKSLGTLLRIFRQFYTGLVTWDVLVPSTYNVAFTDCGVNSTIPVKYSNESRSFYRYMTEVLGLPVVLDLHDKFTGESGTTIWGTDIPSTGSKKNDPYYYAVEKYMKTDDESQQTNPYTMSRYLDGWNGSNGYTNTVYFNETGQLVVGTGGMSVWSKRWEQTDIMNRDYFVAKKAFFFDLSPMMEAPIDDPYQTEGRDRETFEYILAENNKRAGTKLVEVGGFINWQVKYSSASTPGATHEGMVEPELSRLLAKYNCVMHSDAPGMSYMCNASIYTNYPAQTQYDQSETTDAMKAKAKEAKLENKNYLLFYQADYDGSTWTNALMAGMFNDPKRGEIPIMWPIVPVIESRVKHVYDFMYENAGPNDVFVGGNNGYGYSYVDTYLRGGREGINGTIDDYFAQTAAAYEKYDIDVQGCYFGSFNPQTDPDEIWQRIYSEFAKITPYGFASTYGRVLRKKSDYNWDGGIFFCQDPYDRKDKYIQCGSSGLLVEGTQDYQVNIMDNAINCTELGRPNFIICRPVITYPSQLVDGVNYLKQKYPEYQFEVLDPYTFFALYEQYCDAYLSKA